ncbi:NDR1/HIN1-like protein 13 [Miscanthus floridulus]|uniref:NDR1/HIN1-like protein 13 n=1 Tax=Miscanthus floridulus TaxID=154761 RepID=UPI003458987B
MAERALPPALPASPEPASSSAVSTAFGSPLEPVAATAASAAATPTHDTYVVQVQKDQIYRVPPPENAYLAERYRNERGGGGNKKSGTSSEGSAACSPCVLRTLGALLAAAALVSAAVLISLVVLRPGVPGFSVDRITVINSTRQQRVDYDVFLTAVNPNKMTALWYRSGKARLTHHGTTLAKGDVGQPADGGEDATDFSVLLQGVKHNGRLPKTVEKGFSGSKDHLALQLTVEVTVQVHVGALGFGQRRLAVDCGITAAGLGKDVHIASQNCKSTFRN